MQQEMQEDHITGYMYLDFTVCFVLLVQKYLFI